ncbi:MAG TPA: STAS domain-containing protein [Burkholderiales bacterium]|nr:STAS domain-containing protein [Burkholderiales bacterium]
MISCDGERCAVQGPLTLSHITAVLAESAALFTGPRLIVDLSGVTEVDSSAVSLLLEWRREAARANRKIEYANIPPNLTSLAELYGVLELIHATSESENLTSESKNLLSAGTAN